MKLAIAFAALAFSSSAFAEINKACWDGTFGYNYARAVESSRGVEISFSGSSLQLPELYDHWNHAIKIGDWSNSHVSVHVVLPTTLSALPQKPADVKEDDFWQPIYPLLYLKHSTVTLGGFQAQITPIELLEAKAEITDEGITLSYKQHFAPGDPAVETLSIPCNHSGHVPSHVALPKEIVKHLDSKTKK